MYKQDITILYIFIIQIFFHSLICLCSIYGIHWNPMTEQHLFLRFLYIKIFLSISIACITIFKVRIIINLLSVIRDILLLQIFAYTFNDYLSASWIFPCNTNSYYIPLIFMYELSAYQSGLCCPSPRRKKYMIKENPVCFFKFQDFPITVYICLCSQVSMAAALYKIRIFPMLFSAESFSSIVL